MKKIFLILTMLIITGCGTYDMYELPEDAYITINDKSVEVYDDFKLYDLIGETNMEVLTKDKTIQTDDIGEYMTRIDLKYNDKKYKKNITYKVVDSKKPIFISAAGSKTVKVNDDIYLLPFSQVLRMSFFCP